MFPAIAAVSAALVATTLAHPAPPAPGRGYGLPLRTIDGLDDVRAALVADDGTVTAALGPGGVVRVARDGTRTQLLPAWPLGRVAEAGALAELPDGRVAVADTARGGIAFVRPDAGPTLVELRIGGRPIRPVGLAVLGERLFVADGSVPRIVVCDLGASVQAMWDVQPPEVGAPLVPLLAGIAAGDGTLLVSDCANHRVIALAAETGAEIAALGDRGAFPGMWQTPLGLGWDGSAFLVTDQLNHRVVRVDRECKVLDQWGMHAVRPREGNGRIHYPTVTNASADGQTVAVAEPFERRVQLFGGASDEGPSQPKVPGLPTVDGVASHFSTAMAVDGRTMLVYEPESASALVFDLRPEVPIHVTTFGGPGLRPGLLGQVTALAVDEAANRLHLVDPLRGRFISFALVRDGTAPHFDPFMARLVREVSMEAVERFVTELQLAGPARVLPVDLRVRPGPDGGFVMLDACGPRVFVLDRDFRPTSGFALVGDDRGVALATQLALPSANEAMVVDMAGRCVRRFAIPGGAPLGTIVPEGLVRPFGIAPLPAGADGRARIAMTDAGGDRVAVVAASGDEAVVVASGGSNGSKPSELWEPAGIAWCPADGRLYVTDHGNHRVQSFDADARWASSFGIGRAFVRPKDPQATGPVPASGSVPAASGAADTRQQLPQPVAGADGWTQVPSNDGHWTVRWRFDPGPKPPLRDPFAIDIEVRRAGDAAAYEGGLVADAAMPQHGHGMNVAPTVTRVAPGRFRAEGMLFHMPGYWELYFDLLQGGGVERAQGAVTLE